MVIYKAPLPDMRFILHDVLDYQATVGALPGYEDANRDAADSVIAEAARFCEAELLPLNGVGDREGCRFDAAVVTTPRGFKAAYRKFSAAGWLGLACAAEHGGQGLPKVLQLMIDEMISSTNVSFGTYPGLSYLASELLVRHGDAEQKRTYLPKLTNGSWSGTMCMTEPQCGSDLGLIRTKARPAEQNSYRLSGTKIFITAGEQDLTENIIYIVLGRLAGAPSGTKGLSLFLVPKYLPETDGRLGARNTVSCGSIEKKMGLNASATCTMNFDGARGYLIGTPQRGIEIMFTMMNAARLAVGLQGLGIAETAYQSAAAYAKARLQGRALSGVQFPNQPADPIIVHPDVRQNLLTMRAYNEGARALACWIGLELDVAARHADPARRAEAQDLVDLMTPVIKSFFTECGFSAANLALQIFGGHGYIRDNGVEQLVRDARIAQIYEGANGIQALDLVGRKLGLHGGRLLRRFFHPASQFIEVNNTDDRLKEFVQPLAGVLATLQETTLWLAGRAQSDREEVGAAASPYLRLFALVVIAYLWARMARTAQAKLGGDHDDFYRAKLATARFYMTRLLPEAAALAAAIKAGAAPIMGMKQEWF